MKIRFVFICLSVLFLVSCGSNKNVKNHRNEQDNKQIESKPVKLPSVKVTKHLNDLDKSKKKLNKYTLKYIKNYAPIAIREMHLHKIPASITIAQGILESGNGRSELASKSNNHFGIKCHKGWLGERVTHDDDSIGECFRKYKYVETSYNDHSQFLTKRKRYAFLFNYGTRDYKKWAKGLKKAGYATDRKYPNKLIKIIDDYKLYEFDKVKEKGFKYEKPERIAEKTKPKTIKSYQVKKGDTLYSIARKFNISVAKLKQINGLKSNTISIGQMLKSK
jgi:flagellum-specific peptidoglycan hydrolase FlgJ